MDSILKIIKYLFNSQNIENNDATIDEFFENGLSFPQFITLIYNVDEIPHILEDPKTSIEKEENNKAAFKFLWQYNDLVRKTYPRYSSTIDKANLLLLILTTRCFRTEINGIIEKCNSITKSIDIEFTNKNDIISPKCLLALLNVITEGCVEILDEVDDFDKVMTDSFEQAKVPLVITRDSLTEQYESTFLIQIDIIFEVCKDTISQIEYRKNQGQKRRNSRRRANAVNMSKPRTDGSEDPILKTLNLFSKTKFNFSNFNESVLNDSIPKVVMFYLNVKSIENVTIDFNSQSTEQITAEQIKNIEAVINFLKGKEIKFQYLKFDFENKLTRETSAELFYRNFLNLFFLKSLKKDFYLRCGVILSTKKTFDDFDTFSDLSDLRVFPALLHFLTEKNLHFDYDSLPTKYSEINSIFSKANVPLIFNEKFLDSQKKLNYTDEAYYQLQIIFNEIDSIKFRFLRVFQIILYAIYTFKKIKVPKFDHIAGSIRAKRKSLEFQSEQLTQYLNRKDSRGTFGRSSGLFLFPLKKNVKPYKTYRQRQEETTSEETESKEEENVNEIQIEPFEKFWDSQDSNFGFDSGIIYDKEKFLKNQRKSQIDWKNAIKYLTKTMSSNSLDKLPSSSEIDLSASMQNTLILSKSTLYKVFYYDESLKRWTFQLDILNQLGNKKKLGQKNLKTPVISYLVSKEEDLISIMSNFITSPYPKLDLESKRKIFVYAFSDKTLDQLDPITKSEEDDDDFQSKKKLIKPIFLLFHVPKEMEDRPDLQKIVFQIYCYLSVISDLEIVVLDNCHYLDQIDFMKSMKEVFQLIKKQVDSKENNDKKSSDSEEFMNEDINNDEEDNRIEFDDESDDDDDDFELEEDKWEDQDIEVQEIQEDEEDNNEGISDSLRSFFGLLKYSKTIFLINDPTVQINKEIEKQIRDNMFFDDIEFQFKYDSHIHYINVNDIASYGPFLSTLTNSVIGTNTVYNHFESCIMFVDVFHCCSSFAHFRSWSSSYAGRLKNIIYDRYSMLESSRSLRKTSSFALLSELRKEVSKIGPSFDIDFRNECENVLLSLKDYLNQKDHEVYSKELLKSSDSHLDYIRNKMNTKVYWTEQQMEAIKHDHIQFLKNEFFDIIKLNCIDKIYNVVYEANIDILKNQINDDMASIDAIFEPFVKRIELKKSANEKSLKEQIKKGANYALKETENLREIMITVQINKDLKTEIEQDF
ncbi:hypothetical protein M9Y10_030486 [Tritrichomonas musculus]|uniref:Uncharacterized protein n=1 Tax=Tritrichomonas musculus TaxID=1915356 RepID=A0ABR2H5I5_9EUKA